jgi:hypothetical protein
MEPILDKARGGQNFLEKIMNAIPGFKGYREKELRRDADKLQREHLATKLEECKRALNEASAAATRSGSLDVINDIETARKRLDKVINRIRYADRGYAGFFAAVKVDEAALDRVYEFDAALLEGVAAVGAGARHADSDPMAGVQSMIGAVDALDRRMDDREEILGGLK